MKLLIIAVVLLALGGIDLLFAAVMFVLMLATALMLGAGV